MFVVLLMLLPLRYVVRQLLGYAGSINQRAEDPCGPRAAVVPVLLWQSVQVTWLFEVHPGLRNAESAGFDHV